MEKEAKELLDFVEYVVASENLRLHFRRRKNKIYRWDLKYKDDDIENVSRRYVSASGLH